MKIQIKRIYEEVLEDDGVRVLVDRLWPRGVSKQDAQLDAWVKEIAPSTEARKDFGHKPENFEAFQNRYRAELDDSSEAHEAIEHLVEEAQKKKPAALTLLYAAKDEKCNHALVLRDYIENWLFE